MTSELTTLSPASIIVANWREKIWRDFGLIFLNAPPIWSPASPSASARSDCASRPFMRSCSRASVVVQDLGRVVGRVARVGGRRSGHLRVVEVDRAVAERAVGLHLSVRDGARARDDARAPQRQGA